MPGYVAFLRGINVGGRRATSDQLCSCLREIGFEDVATFRASGNVIFGVRDGAPHRVLIDSSVPSPFWGSDDRPGDVRAVSHREQRSQ